MTDTHEHHFHSPPNKGLIVMCDLPDCSELAAGTGDAWRPLTPTERTNVTIHMWEDLIWVDALTIIHGRTKAIEMVAQRRGYYRKEDA